MNVGSRSILQSFNTLEILHHIISNFTIIVDKWDTQERCSVVQEENVWKMNENAYIHKAHFLHHIPFIKTWGRVDASSFVVSRWTSRGMHYALLRRHSMEMYWEVMIHRLIVFPLLSVRLKTHFEMRRQIQSGIACFTFHKCSHCWLSSASSGNAQTPQRFHRETVFDLKSFEGNMGKASDAAEDTGSGRKISFFEV